MPASSSVSPLPPTAASLGEAADAAAASTARAVADAPASGSAWSCARLRWRFLSRLVSSLALTGTEGGGGIDAELSLSHPLAKFRVIQALSSPMG